MFVSVIVFVNDRLDGSINSLIPSNDLNMNTVALSSAVIGIFNMHAGCWMLDRPSDSRMRA